LTHIAPATSKDTSKYIHHTCVAKITTSKRGISDTTQGVSLSHQAYIRRPGTRPEFDPGVQVLRALSGEEEDLYYPWFMSSLDFWETGVPVLIALTPLGP
jgi:hypothetical protein